MATNYAKYREIIADLDISDEQKDDVIGAVLCIVEALLKKKYGLDYDGDAKQ